MISRPSTPDVARGFAIASVGSTIAAMPSSSLRAGITTDSVIAFRDDDKRRIVWARAGAWRSAITGSGPSWEVERGVAGVPFSGATAERCERAGVSGAHGIGA